jgi:Asp-tRNA(Asn)/Glu-tRNA(Gln) amidotransferase A subunit family amidase
MIKKNYSFFIIIPVVCFLSFTAGAYFSGGLEKLPIKYETVKEAEKLLGLEFTRAEVDSMLTGLEEQRMNYINLRNIVIPNSLSPSLVFNPIPRGLKFDTEKKPLVLSPVGKITLPKNRDDLAFYSVRDLGELIRTRQISSVELTQFYLDRLKKYGPKLECVVTLTEEYALQQARKADQEIKAGKYKGPLHGIPYGAKDLLAKKGYKTTWGAVPYKDQVIDEDATVIKRLDDAGAVLVAKLTLGALAWGDIWYGGKTRNPWNYEQGSSGSSAGTASAVAAGLVPFGIGSETLGSIVSPSTTCGVTGLRPTFGLVSKHGAMALSWSMDKLGPMCRYIEDAAIVLDAISGQDGMDLSVLPYPFNYNAKRKLKDIRVGYLKSDFEKEYGFQAFDQAALKKFEELGIKLIPVELPAFPVNDMIFILSAEGAAAFDDLTRSNRDDLLVRQVKRAWPNVFRTARFIPAVEYIQANRLRTLLIESMVQVTEQVDVFISPSWASNSLSVTNLTGHPCVVLPNGFTAKGNPVSFTIIGKLFGEGDLITVAKAYQDVTDFHKKQPELKL